MNTDRILGPLTNDETIELLEAILETVNVQELAEAILRRLDEDDLRELRETLEPV